MDYYTLLTDTGAAKIAAATANNTTINLSHIALGDGAGEVMMPDASQSELVNEVFRAALNDLSVDANNDTWIVATGYIPADDGNFWVREVGVFDSDGDLIAVGNYPETFKPVLADGVAKDLYVKMIMEVSNSDAITLQIDPSVVMASREFVAEELAKYALINGDSAKRFKVAAAVDNYEAVNRIQMESAFNAFSNITGFKNLIINGCLRVNQRGATSIDETASAYNFDRWYYDGTNFIQYIEDKNIVLSGTYTLSWVGTATATVNGASVSNGGQVTLTANTQCEVKFNSSDFNFVQLEYGNKKTNFEIRPYSLELDLCKRYYEQHTTSLICTTQAGSSGSRSVNVKFSVTKRTIPTISDVVISLGSLSLYHINIDGFSIVSNVSNTTNGVTLTGWVANAEIYPI